MNNFFLRQENKLKSLQNHHLILSREMKESFHILQMPIIELSQWLKCQIEDNPLLELLEKREVNDEFSTSISEKELDFENSRFEILKEMDDTFNKSLFYEEDHLNEKRRTNNLETFYSRKNALYEYLLEQAREHFQDKRHFIIAEQIIGNLDERGFFSTPLEELEFRVEEIKNVLEQIQTFDPPGIAAKNLQDSLLLQLKRKKKESTLAARIIKEGFKDLIHNSLGTLKNRFKCSFKDLQKEIQQEISILDTNPASHFLHEPVIFTTPDLKIEKEEQNWHIKICEEHLPKFRISPLRLQRRESCSHERKKLIRYYLNLARWLKKNLTQRSHTLKKIAYVLVKKQKKFLSGDQKELVSLTIQDVAKELSCHESTVARAISDKYLLCPQGLLPLKFFFNSRVNHHLPEEQVSTQNVKVLLTTLVEKENKQTPLSDSKLCKAIEKQGILCSRRTIAKYRTNLRIPSSILRKKFD